MIYMKYISYIIYALYIIVGICNIHFNIIYTLNTLYIILCNKHVMFSRWGKHLLPDMKLETQGTLMVFDKCIPRGQMDLTSFQMDKYLLMNYSLQL